MKEVLISSVVAIGTALFIFLLEDELEQSAIDTIKFVQRGNSPELRLIFQALSIFLEIILMLASAIIYLTYSKKTGMLSIAAGLISASLSTILKMMITQPRPFWVDTSIDALACPKGFGMPSGHALSVGCSLFILSRLIFKKRALAKVASIAIGVFIISIDRIFLGVHFYYQIILGFAFGMLVCSFFLDKDIKYFLLLKSKRTLVFVITLCWGFYFVFLAYVVCRKYTLEYKWTEIYEIQCGRELKYTDICVHALLEASLLCLFAGFYLGFVPDNTPIYTNKKHFALCTLCAGCLGALVFFICYLLLLATTEWAIFILISLIVFGFGFVYARYIPALLSSFEIGGPHIELKYMAL